MWVTHHHLPMTTREHLTTKWDLFRIFKATRVATFTTIISMLLPLKPLQMLVLILLASHYYTTAHQ